jgi:hypothetical protein
VSLFDPRFQPDRTLSQLRIDLGLSFVIISTAGMLQLRHLFPLG